MYQLGLAGPAFFVIFIIFALAVGLACPAPVWNPIWELDLGSVTPFNLATDLKMIKPIHLHINVIFNILLRVQMHNCEK